MQDLYEQVWTIMNMVLLECHPYPKWVEVQFLSQSNYLPAGSCLICFHFIAPPYLNFIVPCPTHYWFGAPVHCSTCIWWQGEAEVGIINILMMPHPKSPVAFLRSIMLVKKNKTLRGNMEPYTTRVPWGWLVSIPASSSGISTQERVEPLMKCPQSHPRTP